MPMRSYDGGVGVWVFHTLLRDMMGGGNKGGGGYRSLVLFMMRPLLVGGLEPPNLFITSKLLYH
jgi:hypothetical protein